MEGSTHEDKGSIKNLIFLIVMLLLTIPGLQGRYRLVPETPLDGAFAKEEKPSFKNFTIASWLNGSFQEDFNTKLEQNIGFRNLLVRINNQLAFSLYGKGNAEGVVVGKDDMLFEEDYIREYLGLYYVGDSVWTEKAVKLKAVQDTLERLGKKLIIVFEPDKASLYPELLPGNYTLMKKKISNYDKLQHEVNSKGVNVLDLNKYFISIKGKTEYPIFPQCGTHWSYYGATLAADTTLRYLESVLKTDLTDMKVVQNKVYDIPRHPDYDIGLAMNLLFMIPHPETADPILEFTDKVNTGKPSVLVVGDSYFFNWLNNRIPERTFRDCEFWYYNKRIVRSDGSMAGVASERNLRDEVMRRDVIMIMITGRFMHAFAWGFDEQLYDLFYPGQQDPVEYFANQTRCYGDEFKRMYQESLAEGTTLSDRIDKEARFLFHKDSKDNPDKYTSKKDIVLALELAIQGTPEWMKEIERKAEKNNLSVAKQLRLDAEWIYQEKYGKK